MNQLGFDKSTVHLPQFSMPQMRFLKASTQRNKLQNELQSYLQSLITNQTFCYNDILFNFFGVDMTLRTFMGQY